MGEKCVSFSNYYELLGKRKETRTLTDIMMGRWKNYFEELMNKGKKEKR